MTTDSLSAIKRLVRENLHTMEQAQVRPYSIVSAYVHFDGLVFEATGLATCGPHDVWHPELGMQVAGGKAVADIARQIRRHCAKHWPPEPEAESRYAAGFAAPSAAFGRLDDPSFARQLSDALARWLDSLKARTPRVVTVASGEGTGDGAQLSDTTDAEGAESQLTP